MSDTNALKPPSRASPSPPADAEVAADPDAANVVPAGHKSQFLQFLKSLTSFTGDLSQMTCPSFLLSGVSLLEYSTHWADHPDLFADIPNHTDPVLRMVAVTRWFISTLYGSFHSRCKSGTEKKPFNPVLGEQFYCSWPGANSVPETRLVVEQVSHHPPVGAFYIENDRMNIYLNGHCGQKTKFKTTYIKCEQTGRVVLSVQPSSQDSTDEYFITLPEMALRGLMSGQLFIELLGKSTITSASGYQTVIEYVPKGWFGGQYHTITGTISKLDLPDACGSATSLDERKPPPKKHKHKTPAIDAAIENSAPLYEISGGWTTRSTATRIDSGTQEVLFDAQAHPLVVPNVTPLPDQRDLESRKLWNKVALAIHAGDYANATVLKSAIEDGQRALRKDRASRGEIWAPLNFTFVPDPSNGQSASPTSTHSLSGSQSLTSPSDSSGMQTRTALRGLSIAAAAGATGTDALVDDGSWTYVPAAKS